MLFLDKSPKFAPAMRNRDICPKSWQMAKIAVSAISSDPSRALA